MSPEPAVSIRNLSFAYGRFPVLDGVDLDLAACDFVSIVGPNGGGKTTLLKLMMGLLEPRRGTVRLFGQPPRRSRLRIGYLPQHSHLDPRFPVTVMDVVLMARLGRGPAVGPFRAADRAAALRALTDADAADLGDRPFTALSGGQRQRVLIARALACEPELLLLDEPTASLDPGIQDDLYDLLARLNRKMTVVLVSHDISVVSRHVKRVVCVNVQVVQHPATEIKGELRKLFPGHDHMRLVRHDSQAEALPGGRE